MVSAKNNVSWLTGLIKEKEAKIQSTLNWLKCSSCDQDISEEKRQSIVKDLEIDLDITRKSLEENKEALKKQTDLLAKLEPIEIRIKSDLNEAQRIVNEIQVAKNSAASILAYISKLKKEISANKDVAVFVDRQAALKDQYTVKSEEYITKAEEKRHQEFLLDILKDDGIKAKAVLQYIPIINGLINKYLDTLNFFVNMKLDENFEEEIRVRHRDPQTYYSLSQGERQRIDLALLFTWRDVAKLKNSVNTNLLILDETFDSSLDADGVDNLFAILDLVKKDTNIFVISHKGAILEDRIDTHIQFEKKKNFTTMKRIN